MDCLTCRSRKVKCDERRPKCRNCEKAHVQCVSSDLFSFKHWRNPSISKRARRGGAGIFEPDHIWVNVHSSGQFVDETITVSNEYQDGVDQRRNGSVRQNNNLVHHSSGFESAGTPIQTTSTPQRSDSTAIDYDLSSIGFQGASTSPTNRTTPQSILDSNSASIGLDNFDDVDCHVHLSEVPSSLEDVPRHVSINTPNSWELTRQREDAAGQALLSMRNDNPVAQLARSPLSESTPSIQYSPMVDSDLSPQGAYLGQDTHGSSISSISKEETDLLRQFSVEVGTWMDLSDLSETFSKTVCRLAVHDPLLKAACIACAAKQQYLVGKMNNGMRIAQKNYDVAISLLINRLSDSNEQLAGYGFAAIVICSCYEMLDAPTINWQRHLDGVFSFGKVQKVNGSSGGVAQAAFWSIARQEVACAIINRSRLRLDPEYWVVDLDNIGQEGSEDMINNQVLAILAKVVALMAYSQTHSLTKTIDEWHKLYAQLEHWQSSVKNKGFMDPVSVLNEEGKVFQTIWFVRSVCASSWQMFHLAQILLLTTNPLQDTNSLLAFRTIETQLIYHARQICGIAQSKPDGSCRVNSVQPLYYAGCCFNRDDERRATVKLLEDIENELGWASIYRARDLESTWS